MKNLSGRRIIEEVNTEQSIPKTNTVFCDEYLFVKTDVERYELFVILRPKDKFRKQYYIQDTTESDLIECTHSDKLFTIIKHYLAQNGNVEKLLFLQEDNLLHIWTAISNYNAENDRREIYRKEAELTKFLSRAGFHFDFYLIESEEVNDVLSSGAVVIYEKSNAK